MKERQIAFTIAPPRDGLLPVYFAIPDRAWKRMKNWRSMEFSLVPHGVPLQMMITRCRNRAEGLRCLQSCGLKLQPKPGAGEDWILLGVGEGHQALVLVLIIPDVARRDMIDKGTKHTLDFREKMVAPLLIARRTYADCIAALREVIAGNPIRDLAGRLSPLMSMATQVHDVCEADLLQLLKSSGVRTAAHYSTIRIRAHRPR